MPARRRGADARERGDTAELAPETVLAGRAWVAGRLQPVEVGIGGDGRISRVGRSISGGRRWDLGDQVILPAATDLHVHFREPGGADPPEDFVSGTESAALGGVATVGDMPNTTPPVNSLARLRAKQDRARGRLAVDVVLFAAVQNASEVGALAREAGAFKAYLSPTTGIETPVLPAEVASLLSEVAATGLALTVHAEDPRAFHDSPVAASPVDWDARRPVAAESRAVGNLLGVVPGARLNVAHVTSVSVAELVRSRGDFFEVTPQHLLLSETRSADARFKVNPPLRSEAERTGLWEMFRSGYVPAVASDHAPHLLPEKERPFRDAPSGVPGVETMLPLLLEKVRAGDLSLDVLLRTACDRPARWLGLPQGRLAPGHRANLLVVDFRARGTIRAERLRSRCGWSPFEGWPAVVPTKHFRDGELIVDAGSYVGRHNGRVLRPEYVPSPNA